MPAARLGRPPGTTNSNSNMAKVAARHHAQKAIDTLVLLLDGSQPGTVRCSAATQILDRAFGRPAQAVEMSGPDGGAIEHRDVTNDDAERLTSTIFSLVARSSG